MLSDLRELCACDSSSLWRVKRCIIIIIIIIIMVINDFFVVQNEQLLHLHNSSCAKCWSRAPTHTYKPTHCRAAVPVSPCDGGSRRSCWGERRGYKGCAPIGGAKGRASSVCLGAKFSRSWSFIAFCVMAEAFRQYKKM